MHDSNTVKLRISPSSILASQPCSQWLNSIWLMSAQPYGTQYTSGNLSYYMKFYGCFCFFACTFKHHASNYRQINANTKHRHFYSTKRKIRLPIPFNPITLAARSKAKTVFCTSNTGILGFSPYRSINLRTCSFLCLWYTKMSLLVLYIYKTEECGPKWHLAREKLCPSIILIDTSVRFAFQLSHKILIYYKWLFRGKWIFYLLRTRTN
jgi:hypothetical protein